MCQSYYVDPTLGIPRWILVHDMGKISHRELNEWLEKL